MLPVRYWSDITQMLSAVLDVYQRFVHNYGLKKWAWYFPDDAMICVLAG